ncbi:MAG: ATP-binding cassette domain-containing protein [Caulobacteraceae bacterium]|nr:ATP-binding cassette domain-containing protein [Caulobacteraceae bacterium]
MSDAAAPAAVVVCAGLGKSFKADHHSFQALQDIDFQAAPGAVTALVGSDGAGKTTLLRLMAGLLKPDAGVLTVVGVDAAAAPGQIQARIGYMPQRFGLYDDLTVQENLDLYADLHGVSAAERAVKYPQLMEMTALSPFTRRLAGQLSGGMKQKLGLACTLVSTPELLLLDEPTAGVDPLSRRELWQIIRDLVRDTGLPVIVSTSYLDEADRCDHVIVLHRGKVLTQGAPASVSGVAAGRSFLVTPSGDEKPREMQARLLGDPAVIDAVPEGGRVRVVLNDPAAASALPGVAPGAVVATPAHFEDGFMTLLRAAGEPGVAPAANGPTAAVAASGLTAGTPEGRVEVQVRNLVRRFGAFTAVDNISFEVRSGEIFGLLGPNGAGKTTTFRMLCGLLSVTGGELKVGGADMRTARASGRGRLGYVAQKFSLYGLLSVRENLDFFASVYGLRGAHKRERIDWALHEFELTPYVGAPSARLAGGHKQRLAMAAALLHEPELLFLDEPTSGADPMARRDFWRRITDLSDRGVTVIITTHFMAEAEYCDRIAILDGGRILAQGAPAEIRARGAGETPTMEDAFIAIVEDSRAAESAPGAAA